MSATEFDPQPTAASDAGIGMGDSYDSGAAAGALRLRPGDVVAARYRVLDVLGRGASADVWRAEDLRLARCVALKTFRSPQGGEYDSPERRFAEAQLLAGLSHRNLVAVYDAGGFADGTDDLGIGWIAMELVHGRTLRAAVQDGPLPPALAAAIGRQLADVLDYVHRHGAVHRDVKPANVLLAGADGGSPLRAGLVPAELTVKLTDFGIARLLDAARLTVEGATVGTANYLSPEQVSGTGWGPPVDVYALGLLLLETLTGRIAFPGHGVEAAVARLHRAPDIPAWLPADWHELLAAMTALDPAARPGAADVAEGLAAVTTDFAWPAAEGIGAGIAAGAAAFGAQDAADAEDGLVPGLHADDTAATAIVISHDAERSHRRRGPVLIGMAGAAAAAAIICPLAFAGGAQPTAGTAPAPQSSAAAAPLSGPRSRSSVEHHAAAGAQAHRKAPRPKLAAATPVARASRAAATAGTAHTPAPGRAHPAPPPAKALPPNAAAHHPGPPVGGPHAPGPHKAAPGHAKPKKAPGKKAAPKPPAKKAAPAKVNTVATA